MQTEVMPNDQLYKNVRRVQLVRQKACLLLTRPAAFGVFWGWEGEVDEDPQNGCIDPRADRTRAMGWKVLLGWAHMPHAPQEVMEEASEAHPPSLLGEHVAQRQQQL